MRKLISRLKKLSILPYLIILILGILIYLYIDGKLLFNPDFGQSDIYHGFGVRFYLAESLKNNKLPFWTDKWLGGFPFFSEWQIGSLFLPNIFLYKLLPFVSAVNSLTIVTFFLSTGGFYLLLKEFNINKWLALFISLNFSFNGSLAFRLSHTTLLQTFSLCPLLYYFVIRFLKTDKKRFLLVIPFIVSQMIFSGFIPVIYMVFLSLFLFVVSYIRMILKSTFRKMIPVLLKIGFSFFIGILISFPQILPSMTLSNLSSRSLSLDFDTVTAFPFGFNNLINFISPFTFGNPKNGTYPPYSNYWGIFWENTPYVGPIAILLLLVSLVYSFLQKFKNKRFLIANLLIIAFFLLLALGKYSPLYFLFEFPPFNLFRTQARFLMMVCFSLFFILAISLNNLYLKSGNITKYFIIILLIFNFFDLISVQRNYHLFVNAKKILEQPKFVSEISNENSYITLGQKDYWNNIFLKSGWKSDTEINKYLFYRNFLYPNANFLYNKKTYDISNGFGFKPRRNEYLKSLLQNNINSSQDKTFSLQNTQNLMKLLGVKYVITSWEITDASLEKIDEIKLDDESIYLYEIASSKSDQNNFLYSPSSVKLINTLTDFENLFTENIDFTNNAVIEKPLDNRPINKKVDFRLINSVIKDDSLEITADFQNSGLIVFRKNYYPGWVINIDNQPAPIEKVNLVHMGVFVSEGMHTIRLNYQNTDFEKGLVIAITSYGIFIMLIFSISVIASRQARRSRTGLLLPQ